MNTEDILAGKPEALALIRELHVADGRASSWGLLRCYEPFVHHLRIAVPALLDLVERLQELTNGPTNARRCIRAEGGAEVNEVKNLRRVVGRLEAERDMWKLEAALWRGDRDVVLPKGWTFDPSGDGVKFGPSTYCYRSGLPGMVAARHNSRINLLAQGFSTWHEAMKAAEEAVSKEQS